MFQKDYKEYMNMIKPDAYLVEAMVEEQSKSKVGNSAKILKVAAAVFAGMFLLFGGTVAVDAATDGGIKKLLGIKDSIRTGEVETEFLLVEPTEEQPYGIFMGNQIAEDGTSTTVIKTTDDAPIFTCAVADDEGIWSFQIAYQFMGDETKEEVAKKVYWQFTQMFKNYKIKETMVEEIVEQLEAAKQEIGKGTDLQDGSAMGVQLMIDDLTANTGRKRVMEHAIMDTNDTDGDGDVYEVLGYSFFNFDFDAMKQVTEETGQKEFVVEAIAGIPGKYRVRVEYYEPGLLYYLEPME